MNLSIERNLLGATLILFAASVPVAIAGCDEPIGSQDAANTSLAASDQSGLSGSWVLNLDESDDPREQFGREDRPEGGRRRGMRRRRGDSQGAEGAEGAEGEGPRRGGGGGLGARRQFDITQDHGSVTFTRGNGLSRTLETDGQIITRELRGGEVEIRAFWSDGDLVIERTRSEGGAFTQTYSLSDDGAQLFLTIRIENDRLDGPIEFRLVYDRA